MAIQLFKISCLLAILNPLAFAAEEAPVWLRQASAQPLPIYPKEVHAVVLLNEGRVAVDGEGRVTTVVTYAARILSREGRSAAVARVLYQTDTGKVRELHAWLIRPSGEVKKYGKDRVLDMAAVDNDVYNEVRIRSVIAGDDVEAGAVFGYEAVSEDRSVFTQLEWTFQPGRLPTVLSRYGLMLPPGWTSQSVTFNHPKVEPVVAGSMTTWELRDLPFIEEEPAAPEVTTLAPRLAVSFFPPSGAKTGLGRSFDNWVSVSRWLTELGDPQATTNEALTAKARALTEGAKTEWERIQAIGRFVQSLHYVSIQTGLGRGGGYRPHAAVDVLAKSYGDCKDKANLMRSLLKTLGISSHLLVIFSGDSNYVREEWPSPQQFNHCIIAIQISPETQAPTIVSHPNLGRLLVFDPTDDDTPLGDLPRHEQGSLALLVAGDAGRLLQMPVMAPEANHRERQVEATLEPDGALSASLHESSRGQSAVDERRGFRHRSQRDYVKLVEQWIAHGATGAKVLKVTPTDNSREGRFELEAVFTARLYGQVMQNRLLVFKPAVVPREASLFFDKSSRKYPIQLKAQSFNERVSVTLPSAFAVDEMPDSFRVEVPFGSFAATYEVKDGQLLFTRSLSLQSVILPAEQYASVRRFFDQVGATDQAPVILLRK